MKRIGIAELKSHLSENLREAASGRTVVVLDRERPIAEIVPYREDRARLVTREPKRVGRPGDLKLGKALRRKRDVVDLLLEERQSAR